MFEKWEESTEGQVWCEIQAGITLALEIFLRTCAGYDREPLGSSNVTAPWSIWEIAGVDGESCGKEPKLGSHMLGTNPGPVTP